MKLMYKCKLCDCDKFETKHELYEHKKNVHNVFTNGGQQPKYTFICKYCGVIKHITRATMTRHEMYCAKNPNRQQCKGHKNTEDIRKRISLGMKLAHKEGRASS